jgi:DNA-binding protein Alba
MALMLTLNKAREVILKARGRNILQAINLVEIAKRQFNCEVVNMVTSTETTKDSEGKEMRVSALEVMLRKKSQNQSQS